MPRYLDSVLNQVLRYLVQASTTILYTPRLSEDSFHSFCFVSSIILYSKFFILFHFILVYEQRGGGGGSSAGYPDEALELYVLWSRFSTLCCAYIYIK